MKKFISVIGAFFLDIIETIVIALSVFLVVYLFFMQPHQVNGQSMVPTFIDQEYLLTDKVSYKLSDPHRGDLVVFHAPSSANCPPGGGCDFIKRVIGVPGDVIDFRDGQVYVNNEKLDEPYLDPDIVTETSNFTSNGPIRLGADEYFVMGDNRPHSSDSRTWGPISESDIVGKVFFRYWPPDKTGLVR